MIQIASEQKPLRDPSIIGLPNQMPSIFCERFPEFRGFQLFYMAGGCSMASSMAILSLSKRERVYQPVSCYSLLLNMSHLVR